MDTHSKSSWPNFIAKLVSIAAVVGILCFYSQWAHAVNAADAQVRDQMIADERAANRGPFDVADGTYQGKAKGYGGDVIVSVTMSNGYIDSVKDVSHANEDDAWWSLAKSLFETILKEQSTDVDTVSTATYSSTGIINATKKALQSAPKWNP